MKQISALITIALFFLFSFINNRTVISADFNTFPNVMLTAQADTTPSLLDDDEYEDEDEYDEEDEEMDDEDFDDEAIVDDDTADEDSYDEEDTYDEESTESEAAESNGCSDDCCDQAAGKVILMLDNNQTNGKFCMKMQAELVFQNLTSDSYEITLSPTGLFSSGKIIIMPKQSATAYTTISPSGKPRCGVIKISRKMKDGSALIVFKQVTVCPELQTW